MTISRHTFYGKEEGINCKRCACYYNPVKYNSCPVCDIKDPGIVAFMKILTSPTSVLKKTESSEALPVNESKDLTQTLLARFDANVQLKERPFSGPRKLEGLKNLLDWCDRMVTNVDETIYNAMRLSSVRAIMWPIASVVGLFFVLGTGVGTKYALSAVLPIEYGDVTAINCISWLTSIVTGTGSVMGVHALFFGSRKR